MQNTIRKIKSQTLIAAIWQKQNLIQYKIHCIVLLYVWSIN